tara:strand:- start:2855 stop:3358 length:504 start_codon:yes stop_codon:yes gene_type:complete
MKVKNLRFIYFSSFICVPILFLLAPKWLTLQGVAPCWPVLWLLPWVLERGKIFGLFYGFSLGLLMDSLSLEGATQIPALMVLGLWWGQDNGRTDTKDLSLNFGLLALLGATVYGLSIWIQLLFFATFDGSSWLNGWALHTLLAQSILTGLLAPMICSWAFLARREIN